MCLERIVRNAGFALAAVAVITAVCFSIEHQPLIALAQ